MVAPTLSYEIDTPGTKIRSFGFKVDQMMADEGVFERRTGKKSPLKTLFDCWVTSPIFEPLKLSDIWVQNIDLSAESPLAFVWHRHTGLTFGNLSGRTVGSLENRFLQDACAVEYSIAKRAGQPVYHLIEQTVDGVHRKYTRLMIPVSGEMLYYVYRLIDPPTPIEFSLRGSD